MRGTQVRRPAAIILLTLLTIGVVACGTAVGVGVAVPVHGGWGPRPEGGYSVSGAYVGGPAWP
jgi:hypothetical protein